MFGSKLGLDAEFRPTSGRLTNGHDVRYRSAAKQFIEPPEQIRREIAALKADKSVSETQKKEVLKELEAALKTTRPIQFKENIALVLKYFDKLQPRTRLTGAVGGSLASNNAIHALAVSLFRLQPQPELLAHHGGKERRLQSLIASATSATGLTVGCDWSSSRRPARNVLIPA